MGPQHHPVVYVEGILHIPGRMVQGQVQLGKVIIVILHLGSLVSGEPHSHQCVPDLPIGLGHGMQPAQGPAGFAGLRHV